MVLGKVHSPANPWQGSSLSTYGYKASSGIMAFSIGDQLDPDEAVTRDPLGNMPIAYVSDSIMTFSHPQTHSYFGIGDVVVWDTTRSGRIVKKISTRQWEIRTIDGDMLPDSNGEVVSFKNLLRR